MSDWMDDLREEKREKGKAKAQQAEKWAALHDATHHIFEELKQTVEQLIPTLNHKVFDGEREVKFEQYPVLGPNQLFLLSGFPFSIMLRNKRYLVWTGPGSIYGELQSFIPKTGIYSHSGGSTLLSVETDGSNLYLREGGKKGSVTVDQIAQQLLSTLVRAT